MVAFFQPVTKMLKPGYTWMMELKFIFLIMLGIVSAVYLVSLFYKQGILQKTLKGCLLPLILAVYIFGADKVLLPIVLALVFGWAGDVFLLKISDLRFFRIGLASFMAGHICYIMAMFNYTRPFNFPVLVISVAVAVVLGSVLFRLVRPNNEMKIPVIVYETIILIMAISALQIFVLQDTAFGIYVLAGSICFFFFFSMLAFDTFRRKTKYGYFFIMLTYIAAQLLIALGFCAPGL
jgi:uncharacterized membrane protein YhhN